MTNYLGNRSKVVYWDDKAKAKATKSNLLEHMCFGHIS